MDIVVNANVLRHFGARVFERLDLPQADADLVSASLVEADLRGVHSHGVLLLPGYINRLKAGGINPHPAVRVVRDTAATALLDGDNGMGQVVARRAMGIAIDKARHAGMGGVGVMHSHHYAAGAYWAQMALAEDMIGLAMTNAGAHVAPWGGTSPRLGTNPWTIAVPAGAEYPIVLDMATSVVAAGRLVWALKRGEPIPADWAVDGAGAPTCDPAQGLAGRLLPTGAYKGYGLAVIVEALAGILTGASLSLELLAVRDPASPLNIGHFFQAIRVDVFMEIDRFRKRVDELVRALKQSELEPGSAEILLPGEREFRLERERRSSGIPLPVTLLKELQATGDQLSVQAPWRLDKDAGKADGS